MATYDAIALNRPQHMQAFGNVTKVWDKVAAPATLTTTDKLRLVRVPAGMEITSVLIDNTDMDTGATITHKVGYEPAKSTSALAPNDAYFGTGLTHLRAAGRQAMSGFDPIVFQEDVFITLTPTAGPATTAGSVWTYADGITRGVK